MKCPNCYSNVASDALVCPRCDWPLKTPAAPTASAASGESSTADPWGSGRTDAAAMWEPAPQRPPSTWDHDSARESVWDNAPKDPEYAALPPAGKPAPGVTPVGGAFQRIAPSTPGAAPTIDAPLPPVTTIPLTGGQKTQLLAGLVIPVLFPAGFVAFFMLQNSRGNVPSATFDRLPGTFLFIFGLIFLFLVYQAQKNIRDFASGVALVQTTRLLNTSKTRHKNSVTYYGEFAQLGKLRISRGDYTQAQPGGLYRITYSPASKRVWNMTAEVETIIPPPLAF